jgi:hypothetical protein
VPTQLDPNKFWSKNLEIIGIAFVSIRLKKAIKLIQLIFQQVAECAPYDKNPDSGSKIAPCGAIANSMFNGLRFIFKSIKILNL